MWSGSDLICSPCPAGAWCANNVLTECPAGTASDTLLASTPTECQSCQPGWYQPGAKSSVCLPCPAGSVCPGTGRTVPGDQCPPGEWAPTQATACTQCPAGTASDTAGVAVCPLCPDGTAQPQVGQTSCSACAVGEQPSADKAQCVDCLPGTSSSSGVSCQACPLGHHAPASRTCAKLRCLGAASGCVREAACFTVKLTPSCVLATGASSCIECPPGTYADITGLSECRQCPVNTFGALPASSSESFCTKCPASTVTLSEGQSSPAACIPTAGFVIKEPTLTATSVAIPCPTGFNCTTRGYVGTHTLPLSFGFWRADNKTLVTYECEPSDACIGGTIVEAFATDNTVTLDHEDGAPPAFEAVSKGVCREGHYGPMCSFCRPSYYRSFGLCKRCRDDAVAQFWLTSLVVVLSFAFVCGVMFLVYKRCSTHVRRVLRLDEEKSYAQQGLGKERLADIQAKTPHPTGHAAARLRAAGRAIIALSVMTPHQIGVSEEDDMVGNITSACYSTQRRGRQRWV